MQPLSNTNANPHYLQLKNFVFTLKNGPLLFSSHMMFMSTNEGSVIVLTSEAAISSSTDPWMAYSKNGVELTPHGEEAWNTDSTFLVTSFACFWHVLASLYEDIESRALLALVLNFS